MLEGEGSVAAAGTQCADDVWVRLFASSFLEPTYLHLPTDDSLLTDGKIESISQLPERVIAGSHSLSC